jgi:hypothetical protein
MPGAYGKPQSNWSGMQVTDLSRLALYDVDDGCADYVDAPWSLHHVLSRVRYPGAKPAVTCSR